MDGIEKIIERIKAASADECAAIAQKAENECQLIRADYAQKVQSAYDSAVGNGEREIALEAERVIRNARLDARKELLFVKQEMIDTVFAQAGKKLRELPEDEYLDWLARLASEASDGSGELILSERDRPLGEKLAAKANEALLKKGKKAELTVSDETRDIDAGFILFNGKLEVNCTLSAILELKRQELAVKVAEKLFC